MDGVSLLGMRGRYALVWPVSVLLWVLAVGCTASPRGAHEVTPTDGAPIVIWVVNESSPDDRITQRVDLDDTTVLEGSFSRSDGPAKSTQPEGTGIGPSTSDRCPAA
jgi:hypothetical protein